jgi:adenylylsulfate kinase
LAFALEREVFEKGRAVFVLDGDNVRHGLNGNLGFSAEDRTENIRRVAEVARLMNDAGLIVITAFISPLKTDRAMARQIIGHENFLEVFVKASLDVCEIRDPKGMYVKARKGLISDFTGISAPYESPESPDYLIDTEQQDIASSVEFLMNAIEVRCCREPESATATLCS